MVNWVSCIEHTLQLSLQPKRKHFLPAYKKEYVFSWHPSEVKKQLYHSLKHRTVTGPLCVTWCASITSVAQFRQSSVTWPIFEVLGPPLYLWNGWNYKLQFGVQIHDIEYCRVTAPWLDRRSHKAQSNSSDKLRILMREFRHILFETLL